MRRRRQGRHSDVLDPARTSHGSTATAFAAAATVGRRIEPLKCRRACRMRRALGRCLSRHGQHDKAVAYLKQAWAIYQELDDELDQALAAKDLGIALWARARAEHHQAAPDATSCGGVSAASADTLQEAETWLRTALDLAVRPGWFRFRMNAQMHLACVAMMKGDEDEAVELLSQHLQGWLDDFGSHRCAGCGQVKAPRRLRRRAAASSPSCAAV